ncbi:hypothetical protein CABS01_07291 [Colletotrichum abscissum]|uniref:uncharacterized protein n=1 Tax=Colletotrichum abscissum TaxID=1671311 RepID=UPI0027D4DC4D|nr:uncharacterized protein CABS01_07291 [Colletotrichum abscissum]KAK1513885.1 hypothetical protein CABS01_07291 [Colletotrichum abscissum]
MPRDHPCVPCCEIVGGYGYSLRDVCHVTVTSRGSGAAAWAFDFCHFVISSALRSSTRSLLDVRKRKRTFALCPSVFDGRP